MSGESPTEELKALSIWSTDPNRFADLGEQWFEEFEFQLPVPTHLFQRQALEVAAKRAEGMSHAELAEHFGCTVPTIRKAILFARENGLLPQSDISE